MSGGIFISYRRDDASGSAGRLYDHLVLAGIASSALFIDVDNIPIGADFVEVLSERVGDCDALLAVIGKRWLDIRDERGQRRLDDPLDFVRVEIEAALRRKIPVIPVLVDGGRMPRAERLPPPMRNLSQRQAVELTHEHFRSDASRLANAMQKFVSKVAFLQEPELHHAGPERKPDPPAVAAPVPQPSLAPSHGGNQNDGRIAAGAEVPHAAPTSIAQDDVAEARPADRVPASPVQPDGGSEENERRRKAALNGVEAALRVQTPETPASDEAETEEGPVLKAMPADPVKPDGENEGNVQARQSAFEAIEAALRIHEPDVSATDDLEEPVEGQAGPVDPGGGKRNEERRKSALDAVEAALRIQEPEAPGADEDDTARAVPLNDDAGEGKDQTKKSALDAVEAALRAFTQEPPVDPVQPDAVVPPVKVSHGILGRLYKQMGWGGATALLVVLVIVILGSRAYQLSQSNDRHAADVRGLLPSTKDPMPGSASRVDAALIPSAATRNNGKGDDPPAPVAAPVTIRMNEEVDLSGTPPSTPPKQIVLTETKKVKTLSIRPDGTVIPHDPIYSAQFAAPSNMEEAQRVSAKLQQLYKSELDNAKLVIIKAFYNNHYIYRVRATELYNDAAVKICGAVKLRGGSCFVALN